MDFIGMRKNGNNNKKNKEKILYCHQKQQKEKRKFNKFLLTEEILFLSA
jgi:hypothetical protein